MADRDELLALAARCEAATEGSREFNGIIWCALDGRGYTFRDVSPPRQMSVIRPDSPYPWFVPMPAYSTSIDAALTLVPEGGQWQMVSTGEAWVFQPLGEAAAEHAVAATPALALCAAALRARAAATVDD